MSKVFRIMVMVLTAMISVAIMVAMGYYIMKLPWWGISIIAFILILFFTYLAIKIDTDVNKRQNYNH